ncbi:myomesin 1a (skelemin) isoform X1 [Danio rerio]|uniref:Myomesin 1A (skelemin) n=1 Tax=Danio rerio TaxID=7955 RepID=A0A8M1NUG4_DANRE|nr:myomesin 1a (skelemin) [Danio rerio]XP_005163494.1 myomesin 1a isoform X1 [Danio rerio]|eukprot:NP_001154812.1 myomesin 1a [Danio rerio]
MSESLKLQKEQEERDLETRYESSYHQSSLSSVSRQSYTAYVSSHGHKISGKKKEKKLTPLSKKEKRSYLAVDKEDEVIGYVVPVFRSSHLATQDLMETQEEVKEEGVGYVVMRNLFARESGFKMRTVKKTRETSMRESAERMALSQKLHEKEQFQKKMNPDSLTHPPEFIVKPRGQTVWEGKSVTLHCTVAGWPKPRVAWYKNNVLIDAKARPEKYFTESQYNMHSLEIKNCTFSDTAEYRISALNVKGESSAFAPVIIKRFKEEEELVERPHGYSPEYGVTFNTTIIDKFDVSFGREGETMSLGCTVIVYPTVKRYQPEIVWYRNGVALSSSKWVHMHWSGEKATLTLVHLNKEDEGLYTLRVNTKSGFDTHSAYVFVRDADVEEEGVPVAPLDVRCHDANKDYVVVTWKQPAVEGSSAITGYFIDRLEVGNHHWTQCNDTPVKYARFPVTGLIEGRSYMFRVRALNNAGVSRPSRVSDPVVAMDPSDRARLRAGPSAPWTGVIKFTEEDPTVGVIPGPPTDLAVTEATKSYVVLSWKPPVQRGHEGVMYYVEKCLVGTDAWQRVNTGIPVKSPRFALFDLAEDKSYTFRVRSCNSAGVGEPSEETGATTVGDRLDLPSAPGPVIPIRNTDSSVVVCWGASKEVKDLVGYYIEVTVDGSGVWAPCNNKPVKGTRFVCHGLNATDKCTFRVKAVNAAGYSGSSAESEACLVKASIAVPSPPTGVTTLERLRDYMVIGWQAPAKTGGADIRGYYLDYRTVKDGVTSKWHELNLKAVTSSPYKVTDLKENEFYQFQVRAFNQAGISEASIPTAPLECKEWTVAVPGPPHGLRVQEVRKDSMVVLWEPPTFNGRSPVTGYYVDFKEENGRWRCVQERSTKHTYMKVSGLQEGISYRLRIHAKNLAGVGVPSKATDAILAETRPGTNEIVVDVDDNGVISLIFECSDLKEDSQFVWSKNYEAFTDSSRLTIQTTGGKSRAIFNDPSLDDLGIYSCVVTNTDGVSASYTLTEEGLKRLLDISHDHQFPIIPFKSEMAIELQEKGRVRFWAEVGKFTSNLQVEYVFNDNVIHEGKKYTMNFNKSTGIIEMFMDLLEVTDEGTFTFNLVDGKATGRTSLVLIGEEFAELQKKSEFERAEWVRRQGPHFVEYLSFEVTPECDVHLKCKVGNIKPATEIAWFKDGIEIEEDDEDAKKIGKSDEVLTFDIGKLVIKSEKAERKKKPATEESPSKPKISKKDAGVYEVKLKDERGKDKTLLNLTDAGYQAVLNEVFRVIANSSTELKVMSTEHGIILYSFVVHYLEDLRVGWLHKESKISHSDRVQCGVTGEQLWLKINEPTEKDKGKYAIDIFDGKGSVKRVLDLSGQVWEEAFEEFKRLKAAAIAERNRARVVGGLPDVVTIQEGKSLNLTGNVWGDPAPEVSWIKNEKPLVCDEHHTLKYEHSKFASITIAAVTTTDSGKYALLVKNKYGTEAAEFTVSVYIPEDEAEKKE